MLIVLEGLDGCGKSTQAKLLKRALAEKIKTDEHWKNKFEDVSIIQFPERSTSIGKLINNVLTGKESLPDDVLSFLFAANKFENYERLSQADMLIIAERYIPSAHVYDGDEHSLTMHEYLPQADITFFLDLPYTECCRRCDKTEKYEKTLQEFEKRHERYVKYFSSLNKSFLSSYKVINVKEDTPVEVMAHTLFEHVVTHIDDRYFTKPKAPVTIAPTLPDISKYIGKRISMSISVNHSSERFYGQAYYAQGWLTLDENKGYAILDDVFHIPLKCITSIAEDYGISMNPFEVVTKPRK